MSHKLFVGHLHPDCRTRDLEDLFQDNGFSKSIDEVVVKAGYGFVRFTDQRDADDAIYELNNKTHMGQRIQVEFAKSSGGGRDSDRGRRDRYDDRDRGGRSDYRDDRRGGGGSSRFGRPYNTEHRIIVDNVSSSASWQDLKDFFRKAGEVTFTKCHQERQGEGVVEFANSSDMRHAMKKLDGKELWGKCVKLHCPSMRSRSRSCSRSRRRSRSRSRSRSPIRGRGGRSRSRSKDGSRSRSRSKSRSASPQDKRKSASKSRSRSPSQSPR